jgi:mRNA interferase HigB
VNRGSCGRGTDRSEVGQQVRRPVSLVPRLGTSYLDAVKIISRLLLRRLWEREGCEDAKQPLLSWFKEVERARWRSPADVKKLYGSADFVGDGRIVFNIGGNKYRLVVWVKYSIELVLIKWVGTHEGYDAIDVTKIGLSAPKKKTR